jgi:hypothetical protein
MFTKTRLALMLAYLGVLVLGLGTVAQAGSKDEVDHAGGYRAYGFAPRLAPMSSYRVHHQAMMQGRIAAPAYRSYAYARTPARPLGEETYIGVQDRMYRHSEGFRHRDEYTPSVGRTMAP